MGVRWAMPLSPSWEPRTCFLGIVRGSHAKRAKRVIRSLPVSRETYTGVWRRGTTEEDKRFWRLMAWASLALVVAGALATIVQALRS
jgi:hypothetical protein